MYGQGFHAVNDAGSESAPESVVPGASKLPQTSDWNGRSMRLAALHKAMQKILLSLIACVGKGFNISVCGKGWKYYQAIIPYCSDIQAEKDMSSVNHETTAHSCVRCFTTKCFGQLTDST